MSSHGFEKYVLRDHAPIPGELDHDLPRERRRNGIMCSCGKWSMVTPNTREGDELGMDAWGEHANAMVRS